MVMTHHGDGFGSGLGFGSGSRDVEICNLVSMEVSMVILEDLQGMFGTIKDELVVMIDERLRTFRAEVGAGHPKTREISFWEFRVYGATEFFGKESIMSMHWIEEKESMFLASSCPDLAKLRFTTCIL